METIEDLKKFIEEKADRYFAHPGDRFVNRNALFVYLEQLKSSLQTKEWVMPEGEFVMGDKSSLPKPVEVPEVKQCVADWYENNKKVLDNKIWLYCNEWVRHDRRDPFYQWFNDTNNNPIETLIRMKDGYTVIKEPLYYIELPLEGKIVRYCDQFLDDPKSSFFSSSYTPKKLTEEQIKAIDERYWAFAVLVEGEEK